MKHAMLIGFMVLIVAVGCSDDSTTAPTVSSSTGECERHYVMKVLSQNDPTLWKYFVFTEEQWADTESVIEICLVVDAGNPWFYAQLEPCEQYVYYETDGSPNTYPYDWHTYIGK